MSKKKRLEREFMRQDKRFDHAKAQAEKHIRRSEAWVIIMDDVLCRNAPDQPGDQGGRRR